MDFKALVQDKYFLEYLKNCFETEEYIEEKAKAIYKNKEYKSNNLKISNFVNILKQKELLKLEEHKLVKTHWKTVFKNMCSTDKAKTSKNTINKYEQLLNMVFSIIGKDKIEDINFEDCSKFVSLIYKLKKSKHSLFRIIICYIIKNLTYIFHSSINCRNSFTIGVVIGASNLDHFNVTVSI